MCAARRVVAAAGSQGVPAAGGGVPGGAGVQVRGQEVPAACGGVPGSAGIQVRGQEVPTAGGEVGPRWCRSTPTVNILLILQTVILSA